MSVGQDVRRVEQLLVAQPAHGARRSVCEKDSLAKAHLVEASLRRRRNVSATSLSLEIGIGTFPGDGRIEWIVGLDAEYQRSRVVADDEDRPDREVGALRDAEVVDE